MDRQGPVGAPQAAVDRDHGETPYLNVSTNLVILANAMAGNLGERRSDIVEIFVALTRLDRFSVSKATTGAGSPGSRSDAQNSGSAPMRSSASTSSGSSQIPERRLTSAIAAFSPG